MCGICGAVGGDGAQIRSMTDVMAHRGPDDKGYYTDDDISLGHRRLSIIDLSPAGHQPMSNEDGSVWVTYNGEIYNYKGIKNKLEKKNHRFKSNTDTETLVHLYEEEGENLVQELRGMFAFAIWDARQKKLMLARDRVGIKPLYYTTTKDKKIIFASEIKSLLQHPQVGRAIDEEALHYYLTFQYIPGPRTIFKDVKRLMPGHTLTWKNGRVRILDIKPYWDLNMKPEKTDERQVLNELDGILDESINLRLMSDVPLGAYLSGGVDSSTIVYYMGKHMEEPVKTFTVGFGYHDVDEVAHARKVADHLGTDHHEILVEPDEAIKKFEEIIWFLDEPIADPAIVPTYFLSREAKKHVTVILTGEGGDEAFAGYRAYKLMSLGESIRGVTPDVIKSGIVPKMMNEMRGLDRFKKYLSYIADSDEKKVYLGQGFLFSDSEKKELYGKDFLERTKGMEPKELIRPYFRRQNVSGFLNKLLYVDTKCWIPDDLLMKLDKMTMAHSIEGRVPLLDHKLLEYTGSVDPKLKLKGFTDKYILRTIMKKKLPDEIRTRKKKGFAVPTHHWLVSELKDHSENLLLKSLPKRGYFRKDYIKKLLDKAQNFRCSSQLWGLITLETWFQKYVD